MRHCVLITCRADRSGAVPAVWVHGHVLCRVPVGTAHCTHQQRAGGSIGCPQVPGIPSCFCRGRLQHRRVVLHLAGGVRLHSLPSCACRLTWRDCLSDAVHASGTDEHRHHLLANPGRHTAKQSLVKHIPLLSGWLAAARADDRCVGRVPGAHAGLVAIHARAGWGGVDLRRLRARRRAAEDGATCHHGHGAAARGRRSVS